ncbi:MAG TPA: DUF1254 domain-containing protein [Edaphobacter sp.]
MNTASQSTPLNVNDSLLHARAVQAVIWGMPAVNYDLMYQAMVNQAHGHFNQILYWSKLSTWKNQTLTPNPDAIYIMPFFNTKDIGPMVLEIPPADSGVIVGSIDDCWQTAIEDVGPAGVDKGKGGKYVILPPDYKGNPPAGYFPMPASTYQSYALLRSNPKSGSDADIASAVDYARRIKIYPLSQAAHPPETKWNDALDVVFDSTIPYDERFFQSLNRVVQIEPWIERDRVMIDQLKTIGIEKGKPFNPDAATTQTLKSAATGAHAWLASEYEKAFTPPFYPGTQWALPVSPDFMKSLQSNYTIPNIYPVDTRGTTYSFGFFSAKHLRRRTVLPFQHQGQGRPALRRSLYLQAHPSCQPSGQAVLVGHRLRRRNPRFSPQRPAAKRLFSESRPAKEPRRLCGHLLRPKGSERQRQQLGSH